MGSKAPKRLHRSFFPAAETVSASGEVTRAIADALEQYRQSCSLRLPRLSRPSARKAVKEFGSFCFQQRANLSLTFRSPDELQQSLLAWFDRSRFVDSLLQLGRQRKELVREALEVLVDGYEDDDLKETLQHFVWWKAPDRVRIDNAHDLALGIWAGQIEEAQADIRSLRETALVCERLNDIQLQEQLSNKAESLSRRIGRLREALAETQSKRGLQDLRPTLGAKRRWLTPILADLEQILHEVDGRWELLAQLLRELEGLASATGENVRLRLAEFNRRASP